jgi:hypothetical protein
MADDRRRFDRRSGLTIMAFASATNFLPWMELALGLTQTAEPVGRREWGVGMGMCVLAGVLVAAMWLFGRRSREPEKPRMPDPRRTGLQAALATCAVNALLAGVVVFLGTREVGGPLGEFGTFAFLWCLVALPLQLTAAFALGRASVRSAGRRETAEAPAETL